MFFMNKTYPLEGSYLIATSSISHERLRGSLVYIYQIEDNMFSGIVINKPSNKVLGDYLAYPKHVLHLPVWQGGPVGTERLIAFSRKDRDIYITDRLANLTEDQIEACMFLSGQCVWEMAALLQQIQEGDWLLVGSNYIMPQQIPADLRIDYVLRSSGVRSERYVVGAPQEVA